MIPDGAGIYFSFSLYERQKSSSSIWYKSASSNFHRIRAEFWRSSSLSSGTCTTLRTTSRQKFASTDSSPKKLESRNCRKHLYFFAQMVPGTKGHAQRQTLRHQRVESFDAGEVSSTFGEARCDHRRNYRLLKLIATLWKRGNISGVCPAEIDLSPPCRTQRTIVCTERVIIPNSVKIY